MLLHRDDFRFGQHGYRRDSMIMVINNTLINQMFVSLMLLSTLNPQPEIQQVPGRLVCLIPYRNHHIEHNGQAGILQGHGYPVVVWGSTLATRTTNAMGESLCPKHSVSFPSHAGIHSFLNSSPSLKIMNGSLHRSLRLLGVIGRRTFAHTWMVRGERGMLGPRQPCHAHGFSWTDCRQCLYS